MRCRARWPRRSPRFATPQYPVARPINLDPGYISAAKLVLASTKDKRGYPGWVQSSGLTTGLNPSPETILVTADVGAFVT